MTDKKRIPSKFVPFINAAHQYMMNSNLFGRGGAGGYTGGDNLADTKHLKLWQDFGYPSQIDFYMHWNMWRRNGLAKRGASLPVKLCWMDHPWVEELENEGGSETTYEKAFNAMAERLSLWANFRDGDQCQRIGRYGALLLTIADGQTRDKPVGRISASDIVKVQPLFEGQLQEGSIDTDKNSHRYGLPVTWTLQSGGVGNRNETNVDGGTIHWTRAIILSEDALGSDIYGLPCNEAGFNALLNWQKIQGSGGEGFWRQAAQRFVLQATSGTGSQKMTDDEADELSELIADMFAGFDAVPSIGNYEMKGLNSGTMPQPDGYREMCLEEYAASVDTPAKMLVGTQTGVLAGDEDSAGYMREMKSRQKNDITPWIMSFVNWLDKHTMDMRTPDAGVKVCWEDLTAPTIEKKLDNAKRMADTNQILVRASQKPAFHENEVRDVAGYDEVEQLGDWSDGEVVIDV